MTDTANTAPQVLTNETISLEITSSSKELSHSSHKDQELESLRKQLACMSEAMRLLAAQIRNADLTAHSINKIVLSDDQTIATDCDTVVSEEDTPSIANHRSRTFSAAASVDQTDIRLCEIADELTRSQTADMLTLQNATSMLQEHARLASQEAVLAVHDAVEAQNSTNDWKRRAVRAEDHWAALQDENVNLKMQNEKLAIERRVLIKEVRKLRKAESTKQDYFESYVKGAMNLHEKQLKKKSSEVADDLSTYSALSDEGATVTLKTDKPIHVESETSTSRISPPCTPTTRKSSAPTSPVGEPHCRALSPSFDGKRSSARASNGPHGTMQKVSNFGGAMRRQVQRRFAKSEETHRQPSPPESIDFYPGDCVSPVMSYDSVDGVWSVDSNHSKSSDGDNELDKECSGCVSMHGN